MNLKNNIELEKITPDEFDVNCYVLIKGTKCIIIDPSFAIKKIKDFLNERKIQLEAILLTHCHYDHVGYGFQLAREKNVNVYVHTKEKPVLLKDHLAHLFRLVPDIDEQLVKYFDNKNLTINGFTFEVHETPGHTPGGICLKINDWLFTGDTLFVDSIGRTDFPGGNLRFLRDSIEYICKNFSNKIIICPGHGISATLGETKQTNFFLKNKY